MTTSALFILGWDKVSHLAGREMTRLSIILHSGSMFDRGFKISVNIDAFESTSGLQERPDKTISQISKHCCMLSLGTPVVKQTIPPSFSPVPLSNL